MNAERKERLVEALARVGYDFQEEANLVAIGAAFMEKERWYEQYGRRRSHDRCLLCCKAADDFTLIEHAPDCPIGHELHRRTQ